jgi:hypothetical protein
MAMNIVSEMIPLFQTLIWVIFIACLLVYLRKEIKLVRDEVQRRIQQGGGLELGPIKLLERKVEAVQLEVEISKSFVLSMGNYMYTNLAKIASGHFGPYVLERGSALERELYHLRDIGYIHVDSIRAIPGSGDNLSKYIGITEVGSKFVELREKLLSGDPKNVSGR